MLTEKVIEIFSSCKTLNMTQFGFMNVSCFMCCAVLV